MKNIEVDMHMHSIYSDGFLAPADLAKKMKIERGLKACILTDHDVYQGLPEFIAAAKEIGLNTMTGMEITSYYKKTDIHILAYGFNQKRKYYLEDFIHNHWRMHNERAKAILQRYAIAGLMSATMNEIKKAIPCPGPYLDKNKIRVYRSITGEIPYEDVGGEIGRGGFARVGYLKNLLMTPLEIVKLIDEIGGKAVLAHPGEILKRTDGDPKDGMKIFYEVLEMLMRGNLFGLEAFYSGHTPEQNDFFAKIAEENHLFITAGSDYHGEYDKKTLTSHGISYEKFLEFKKSCSFIEIERG